MRTLLAGLTILFGCAPTGEREPIRTGLAERPPPLLAAPSAPALPRLPAVTERFDPRSVVEKRPEFRALMLEANDRPRSPDRSPLQLQLRVDEPELRIEAFNPSRARTYWCGEDPFDNAYLMVEDRDGNAIEPQHCNGIAPRDDSCPKYFPDVSPMSLGPGERVLLGKAWVLRTEADQAVMWEHGTSKCWVFPVEGTTIRAGLFLGRGCPQRELNRWRNSVRGRKKRGGLTMTRRRFVYVPPNEDILDRLTTPKRRTSNSVRLHPMDQPLKGGAPRRSR